ncbi:MAG: hypothetical protein ACI37O_03255 [Candidatus Avelusimicrobium sp.]|uniref:hypothetical protein n=1 Tax=Candidatus Avelusimicrobium sp. TaxID=3048833 RepID=UPI003F0D3006
MTHNGGLFIAKDLFHSSFIEETKKLWAEKLGHEITTEQALQIIEFWLGLAEELNRLSQLPSVSK